MPHKDCLIDLELLLTHWVCDRLSGGQQRLQDY